MNIGDIMTRKLVLVQPDDTVGQVRQLFASHHFHHVLVVDGGVLVGVVSDRDLLKHLSPSGANASTEGNAGVPLLGDLVEGIMTRNPVTVSADTTLRTASGLMITKGISCLPVVDAMRRPVGILTSNDLLTVLYRTVVQ
jgi:acetoin utilization protein AcuB